MENQNRAGKVLLILAGLAVALCVGMTIGGLLVYGVLRISDWKSSRVGTGDLEMPIQDFHKDLDEFEEELPIPEAIVGAIITEVLPGTPAEEAGLQEGDIVVAVDSQRIGPAGNLARLIILYEPGDRVTLTVRRGDEEPFQIRVKLGENPDDPGAPFLGVRYQPMFSQGMMLEEMPPLGERGLWGLDEIPLPLPGDSGRSRVAIISVAEDSPAASAGLQHGDLLVSLDGEAVDSAAAFGDAIAAHQPGDGVVLGIARAGEEDEVKVRLGEHPDQDGRAYLGVTVSDVFLRSRGLQDENQWMPDDEVPFNWDDLRRRFELQLAPADEGDL